MPARCSSGAVATPATRDGGVSGRSRRDRRPIDNLDELAAATHQSLSAAVEDAIAFFGETARGVVDQAGEQRVVVEVEHVETKTGFEGGELGKHRIVES